MIRLRGFRVASFACTFEVLALFAPSCHELVLAGVSLGASAGDLSHKDHCHLRTCRLALCSGYGDYGLGCRI